MEKRSFMTDRIENLKNSETVQGRSLWQDARRRLFHNKAAVLSMILLALIILLATFAPYLSPWAYDDPDWSYDFPGPLMLNCNTGLALTATAATFLCGRFTGHEYPCLLEF